MSPRNILRRQAGATGVALVAAVGLAGFLGGLGCVNVKAPDEVHVGGGGRRPVDASNVPPTRSHEEARQYLAEAYDEIRYYQDKVRRLEDDKRELKKEKDEYKKKYEREKDRRD